mmetsp:Transcript_6307/g.14518  ORF Transcript_6307/g.14518 Transcript_6307/m.14518 type:complete len:261 (+) Transcript_6307:196-978(+)
MRALKGFVYLALGFLSLSSDAAGAAVDQVHAETALGGGGALPLHRLCFSFESKAHNLTERLSHFLPDPSKAEPGPCRDAAAAALRSRLRALADPPGPEGCAAERTVIAEAPAFGFGSMMSGWIKPYMYAVDHNLTLWSPRLKAYSDGNGLGNGTRCKLRTLACFFQPLSACEPRDGAAAELPPRAGALAALAAPPGAAGGVALSPGLAGSLAGSRVVRKQAKGGLSPGLSPGLSRTGRRDVDPRGVRSVSVVRNAKKFEA